MTKIKTPKTTEGEKFYYLGHTKATVDDNGNSVDSLLEEAGNEINNINANTGINDYPEFDNTKYYNAEDIVIKDGLLYKFNVNHYPGDWNQNEITQTSIKDALNMAVDAETEAQNVAISDLNANTGISEYPAFDPAVDYAVGDVVVYEGRLRRFVAEHAAGEWNAEQVEEWSEKKERNGEITNIERNIGYNNSLTSGYYYLNDIDNKATTQKTNSEDWYSLVVRCFAGDKFTVTTQGGQNAKSYALTTVDRTIYAINKETEPISNVEITAAYDGYLYVNCFKKYISNFKLRIEPYNNIYDKIEHLTLKDNELKEEIEKTKSDVDSNLVKLEYGEGEFIEDEFILDGVIDNNGDFIEIENRAFQIYRYQVEEGQTIAIRTARASSDSNTRSFAYAYNGDVKIEQIVSSKKQWCEITYQVKEGIDNICVYCNKFEIEKPLVFLTEGEKGLLFRVPELEEKSEEISTQLQTVEALSNDSKDRLDNLEVALTQLNKYQEADCYIDDEGYKSYYYPIGDVGSIMSRNPRKYSDSDTWRGIRISIFAGQAISIKTKGGSTGKAYAITDLEDKVLIAAGENEDTLTQPFTYEITENGYLYVNCTGRVNFPKFEVTVQYPASLIKKELNSLNNRTTTVEKTISIIEKSIENLVPCMYNPRVDIRKEELRILDIGNSYTVDTTHYLPQIVNAAGIDVSDMCIYTAIRSSGSFKTWVDTYYDADTKGYSISKLIGGLTANTTGTSEAGNGEKFRNTLANNEWDVIIIHQVSNYAPYYEEWKGKEESGYLDEFIRIIRKHQPNAAIGCLLVHSYWTGFSANKEGSSKERWRLIAESTKKFAKDYGIDFIIPYGTAIQNLRETSLNNEYDLTVDGTHCANGIADYTAACTYYQSVIAPRYGGSVLGNSARIEVEQTGTYPSSEISVTDDNALICQKAAFIACYDRYEVNNPENIDI